MKAKLVPTRSSRTTRRIVLREFPAALGRSEDADVRLEDTWVSRHHCEITESDGLLHVRDLGSRHGTYVNGKRVQQAALLPDDVLTIGYGSYSVRYRPGKNSSGSTVQRWTNLLSDDESAHAYVS